MYIKLNSNENYNHMKKRGEKKKKRGPNLWVVAEGRLAIPPSNA